MRQADTDLRLRVNGDLALDFGEVSLTSYAGLELFNRYLRTMRFNDLIRTAFRGVRLRGDYGLVAMVRLLLGLLVVGGRRLRHVAYVADDPLVRRFTGLRRRRIIMFLLSSLPFHHGETTSVRDSRKHRPRSWTVPALRL
jgi:hypothetical protein